MPPPDLSARSHVRALLRGRIARLLAWLVPLTCVEVAFDGALTLSYKYLVDGLLTPGGAAALVPLLGALAAALVVAALAATVRDWLYARASTRLLDDVRSAAFDRTHRLSMRFFASRPAGELLARFSSDMAGLENALAAGVSGVVLPALHVVVGTTLLFVVLDWKLALLGTAVWPIVLVGPRIVAPRAARAAYDRKTRESAWLATVDQRLRGFRLVKAYGLEGLMSSWMRRDQSAFAASASRAGFLGAMVERTTVLSIYAVQLLVLATGALMAKRGTITVGVLVSFVTIFWNVGWSLVVVGRGAPLLVAAAGSVRRLEELFAEPPDACEQGDTAPLAPFSESIRFERVTFARDQRMILLNVSFEVRAGEHVALVGPSGSGKSTVLSLLSRFDDPLDGRVVLDGRDLKAIAGRAAREQMGFVLQDAPLFDATIRENIRAGRADATDAEVEAAARAAELHDAVMAMPDGYETHVGEGGSRLSGGQRQRVAIACALVRNARLLVLDEATSALDPATEASVNATLERAGPGRTIVSVTHRLATATRADRILVMADGRLVEKGTHAELLASGRVYPELWSKQHGFVLAADGRHAEITIERLRATALLEPLADAQLLELSRRFVSERVRAEDVVIREGDPGDLFYVVVRGVLSVRRPRASRREESSGELREIARLSDGDQFGELALLNDAPRSATIVALTECLLLTLTRAHFLELIATTPGVRAAVESIAAARIKQLQKTPLATTLN